MEYGDARTYNSNLNRNPYAHACKYNAEWLSNYAMWRDATHTLQKGDSQFMCTLPLSGSYGRITFWNGYNFGDEDDIPTTLRHADYDGPVTRYASFGAMLRDDVSTAASDGGRGSSALLTDVSASSTHRSSGITISPHSVCDTHSTGPPWSCMGDGARHDGRANAHTTRDCPNARLSTVDSNAVAVQLAYHRPTWVSGYDRADVAMSSDEEEDAEPYFGIIPPCEPEMHEAPFNCNEPFVQAQKSEEKLSCALAEPTDGNAKDKPEGYRGEWYIEMPKFKTSGQRRRFVRDYKKKQRKLMEAEKNKQNS